MKNSLHEIRAETIRLSRQTWYIQGHQKSLRAQPSQSNDSVINRKGGYLDNSHIFSTQDHQFPYPSTSLHHLTSPLDLPHWTLQ